MDFEDVVIGSGLAALGAVIGLEHSASVLVLTGPSAGRFSYYDARRTVPCAYLGAGGLGNDWHGVIPTGWRCNFGATSDEDFAATFACFYPHTPIRERLGTPGIFVPWRPIRPRRELRRLSAARGGRLTLRPELAERFSIGERGVEVHAGGRVIRARRLWVAAGVLHTPALLERSLGAKLRRPVVSDHVFCYVGQADGLPVPRATRGWDGMFLPARYSENAAEGAAADLGANARGHTGATEVSSNPGANALYSLRPARFAFRELDFGIEQRAVFGLPTGSAIAKIARRLSPGLLAEALFNRFGLWPDAARQSVYAQVLVSDAYVWREGEATPLQPRSNRIAAATDAARRDVPCDRVQLSRRPEMHIPGIHLHHSVDMAALKATGVNSADAPVQVVDASVLSAIGPDHHSFKMLVSAMTRARAAVAVPAPDSAVSAEPFALAGEGFSGARPITKN